MRIPDDWGRVAGLAVLEDGLLGAVWVAYEQQKDTAHVYDAAVFDASLDRVAEGLNARGRRIAIAWSQSAQVIADRLFNEGGVNMVPHQDANEDEPMLAAVHAKEMVRRLTSGRLVADPRIKEWSREYSAWQRSGTPIPTTPLLVATRYALARLDYAKPLKASGPRKPNHPRLALI